MAKAPDRVNAIRVRQWLPEWNRMDFDETHYRRRPPEDFLLFSLSAADLRRLSGISRRARTRGSRETELGIQRRHEQARSDEIAEYVKHGYPWSSLNRANRESGEFDDLKKPGWLPTAIVVNILESGARRERKQIAAADLIQVGQNWIQLPRGFGSTWEPKGTVPPIEVIDGQHRLWAFSSREATRFELPVVAFAGLDISWQAYLFWTINIKPKKISASFAFDLYPLLRSEDWLDRTEGPLVYRETRAQELIETLWSHPESPWQGRINMLGESGQRWTVSQAAWVRALTNTVIKSAGGRGVTIGGLFGSPIGQAVPVLPWTRPQQAAFVIYLWQSIEARVKGVTKSWAASLRKHGSAQHVEGDPAMWGRYTLLNTDQGVRGILNVVNDLCFVAAEDLELISWAAPAGESIEAEVTAAINSLRKHPVATFLRGVVNVLADFDWRTSGAPGLTDAQAAAKAGYRGSGGYRELRRQLLALLVKEPGLIGRAAALASGAQRSRR